MVTAMTMPLVEGWRPIAVFRLFGFPVTVDISFLVVVAILGWYPGVGASDFVVWVLVAPVAVLVHELGHAFVARTTGAAPTITLAGLGGLTSYLPPRPLSRGRSIAISVAGPAVGIVIGLVLLAYGLAVGAGSDLAATVLNTAIYTTLGWSLLNLLPVLPLDGGQTLRELLPGSRATREVRAAVVSVVVGVGIGLAALYFGLVFGALMAGLLVFTNVMTVRQARQQQDLGVNERALQLLWSGHEDEARLLIAEESGNEPVHPLVHAVAAGDWPAARELVGAAQGGPGAALVAQTVAFRGGAHRESAELGEAFLALPSLDGEVAPLVAYNAACGWARAGEPERGLAAFRRAADLGFADLTAVDSDDDLAPLRPLPGYDEARQQVRLRALARADGDR
jgi:Zn-dependent protease